MPFQACLLPPNERSSAGAIGHWTARRPVSDWWVETRVKGASGTGGLGGGGRPARGATDRGARRAGFRRQQDGARPKLGLGGHREGGNRGRADHARRTDGT